MRFTTIRKFSVIAVLIVTVFWIFQGHSQEYNSALFPHWSDLNGDGRDTKDDILSQKLLMFSWVCQYTGEATSDPNRLDVDHIVPLRWAWLHGADKWTPQERERFANDPENLAVVLRSINREKAERAIDEWLPPNTYHQQSYIQQFKKVCKKYGLPDIKAMNEK